jgi:hypothetical protein
VGTQSYGSVSADRQTAEVESFGSNFINIQN